MVDFPLLPPSSDLASLRIPDSEEYEYGHPRLRSDHGLLTTDPSSLSKSHSYRQVPANALGRRILAESGTGLIDLLFDIAKRTNSSEKQIILEDIVNSGTANGDWAMANNSTNSTYLPDLFYRHSLAMTVVYCIAYLLVFAVGLVGNCFVIAVVYRSPRMRTVTNFFIVNLAIADILVLAFCIPATLTANIFVPWMLGWFMCKTVPYIQGVSVAASVYSLIAVSLDRLLAIWWPMKCQITKRRARIMIFVIWVIALSTTIPWAIYFDLVIIFHDMPDVKLCVEVWPNTTNSILYFFIVNLLFFYILPMILISMCYILIWVKVWKRHIPSDTKDAQIERMQQKSKVKVVKMLVVVVILFVLSWLPLYIIFARIKLGGEIESWEDDMLQIVTPIAQWLGASNSSINPILYAFFNKKYRRGFVAILKSRRCCGRLRYYETVALMSSSGSSMRKSSYYVNNNSSTRRPPPGQDSSVSYISNNTGI